METPRPRSLRNGIVPPRVVNNEYIDSTVSDSGPGLAAAVSPAVVFRSCPFSRPGARGTRRGPPDYVLCPAKPFGARPRIPRIYFTSSEIKDIYWSGATSGIREEREREEAAWAPGRPKMRKKRGGGEEKTRGIPFLLLPMVPAVRRVTMVFVLWK